MPAADHDEDAAGSAAKNQRADRAPPVRFDTGVSLREPRDDGVEGAHAIHLQRRQEGRLRDLHLAELAHALLALLLLLQQLALARDVAAVALRGHVLATARRSSRAR